MEDKNKVILNLTIDWEGDHFKNLHDLQNLLKRYAADIPVTHFICPSYFTSNIRDSHKHIASVLQPKDEVALHLHCYRSLMKHCGVDFQTAHNYYNRSLSQLIMHFPHFLKVPLNSMVISGRGIPLGVYDDEEIDQIICKSLQLLKTRLNAKNITGFRAGGWLLRDHVYSVLEQHGFTYDSSAVPPEILSKGFSSSNVGNKRDDYDEKNGYFTELVLKMWGGKIQPAKFLTNKQIVNAFGHNPVQKSSPPLRIGNITEMPNNGGMSDFASSDKTWIPMLQQAMEKARKENSFQFINFGCHQEGPASNKLAVVEFLEYIEQRKNNVTFTTVSEASRIAEKGFKRQ